MTKTIPSTGRWMAISTAVMLGGAILSGPVAQAQSLTGAFGDPKKDASSEIRIESDVMEVEQKANRAIFIGNVDARRGAVRLRSKRLVANYKEVKSKTGKSSKTEITKLDARGNVVVTSKDQKATGAWAVMDVPTGKVTMGGSVVLTQGGTVIRGEKLELDLRTGKSRLIGTKASGGRVKGVFVPSRKK